MSADDFDPQIERLFAQAPYMADGDAFAARVEQRLETGNRARVLALATAALIGTGVAVRETLSVPIRTLLPGQLGHDIQTVGSDVGSQLQQGLKLDELRLTDLPFVDLGSGMVSNPSLFWIAALAVVAVAAAGLTRLYQEV